MRYIYETAIKLKHVIFNTPTSYIEKPTSPEGNITGEQRRITMKDGDYIVEWNGYEWKKKYDVPTVLDKEWTSDEIKNEVCELDSQAKKVMNTYCFDDGANGNKDGNKHDILAILDFLVRLIKLDNTMTPNRQRSLRSDLYIDITDLKEEILKANPVSSNE